MKKIFFLIILFIFVCNLLAIKANESSKDKQIEKMVKDFFEKGKKSDKQIKLSDSFDCGIIDLFYVGKYLRLFYF
jgi:ABC-type transporter MlaC component